MAVGDPMGPYWTGCQLTRQPKTKTRRAGGKTGRGAGQGQSPAALAQVLGHEFTDPTLLERALTHASATAPGGVDNERMEFLGDRVLGLVIADALIERFPSATEGEMAPRLNKLVRRETCAQVARGLEIGAFLRLAPSEERQGGRDKTAILANAMEAVIAALYLDGGLEVARRFILQNWSGPFDAVAQVPRDSKTVLQELLHARGLSHPAYRTIARAGSDHAPVFTVEVDGGEAGIARADGASKRAAEQAAAAALIADLENTNDN